MPNWKPRFQSLATASGGHLVDAQPNFCERDDAGAPERRGREEFGEISLALAHALPFLGRNHHDGIGNCLVRKARKLTRLRTKEQIVDKAVELLVRSETQKAILH
jgi:hypothetical protein